MKRIILCVLIATVTPHLSTAQVHDRAPIDSTTVRFSGGSSPLIIPDTASSTLWQMGLTHKAFFTTDTFGTTAMMTDTTNHYPINADNWFILKVPHRYANPIVDFWHKYQTDSTHAGGIVEFSLDHGTVWQNIKGRCNTDSSNLHPGVLTSNFYSFNDTLLSGEPAFTGMSDSSQYSRFQFFSGFPAEKTTSSGCNFSIDTIYVRFRFVSDSSVDSLAGWMIDSIKIEYDNFGSGGVAQTDKFHSLVVSPNPSYNGTFVFPSLDDEDSYRIEMYDAIGKRVLSSPYTRTIQLTGNPQGLYYYKVTNGNAYYSGKLMIE